MKNASKNFILIVLSGLSLSLCASEVSEAPKKNNNLLSLVTYGAATIALGAISFRTARLSFLGCCIAANISNDNDSVIYSGILGATDALSCAGASYVSGYQAYEFGKRFQTICNSADNN